MGRELSGHCLCGAVTVSATVADHMDACHCGQCRRHAAGPMMMVEATALSFLPEDGVTIFKHESHGERLFCKRCGTILAWRMQDGSMKSVSPMIFDDPEQFAFKTEIFIEDKPANYAFAGDRVRMTGAEVIAAFMAEHQKD
jgi:hypothetical protein